MSKHVLIFEIFRDGELERTERLDREVIKIGNLPTSHLHLDDPQVSGIHAVIEVSGDTVNLIDLGSTYGTRVNGNRVNRHEMNDGDSIELGSLQVVFRKEEKAVPVAPLLDAGPAGAGRPPVADKFRYVKMVDRPSDVKHYSRRFLSQPSRTDGTVEVAHLWRDHVMAEIIFKKKAKALTLGRDRGNDLVVEHTSIPTGRFHLLTREGDAVYLNVAPGMEGDVYVDTNKYSITEAARNSGSSSIPVTPTTRARIRFGESVVFVHQGTQPSLALPLGGLGLTQLLMYVIFSAVLHGVGMTMIALAPPGADSLDIDQFDFDERLVSVDQMEEEPEPDEMPELLQNDEETEEDLAAMEDGEEGRAGLEEEVEEQGRMAVEGPVDNEQVTLGEIRAREEASERGVVSVLEEFNGPESIFGGTPMGYDDVMAFGAPTGPAIGNAQGNMGLATIGSGRSAGGNHPGGIGIGRISTTGRYGREGDADVGRNLNRMRERVPTEVEVNLGDPQIEGHLDRETIQRVIRQHRREIRDCYQRELQRNPDLSGRIVVEFVIDPHGNVATARSAESDVGSDAVEDCVVRRVRRWRFPAPSTPGAVRVNYPFVFTSG